MPFLMGALGAITENLGIEPCNVEWKGDMAKLQRVLNVGVIYSEKILVSIGHLQKLCKLFPQTLIYLKGAMLIYRLMPP